MMSSVRVAEMEVTRVLVFVEDWVGFGLGFGVVRSGFRLGCLVLNLWVGLLGR